MSNAELEDLLTQADTEQYKGNYTESELLVDSVLEQLRRGTPHAGGNNAHTNRTVSELRSKASLILGIVSTLRGNHLMALEHLNSALETSTSIADRTIMARAINNIGAVHVSLGDFAVALEYFGEAVKLEEENGNRQAIAGQLGNIGTVYSFLEDYAPALEYFEKALEIDKELRNNEGVARNLGNIGIVHLDLGHYDLALSYYHEALALEKELENKEAVARNLGNIAGVYMNLSEYAKALEFLNAALELNEDIGNQEGIAINLGDIGLVYMNSKEHQLALEYLFRAMSMMSQLGEKSNVIEFKCAIADVYANVDFDQRDEKIAEEYLLESISMCEEIGIKKYGIHKTLSELYKRQQRWPEYSEQHENFHQRYVEVQSEQATKQIRLLDHRRKIEESERDRQIKLARFKEEERILHNILPAQIADRIVSGEKTIADSFEDVSVFFSDIVSFTQLSQSTTAEELVGLLNDLFTVYDQLARKHGLEKIKTIGDAYMAVAGAPVRQYNHAERAALFALDVAQAMRDYRTPGGDHVHIRIGLHSGNAVAGIIGENKFAYDVWGDAVNIASRMESHGEGDKIHVSEAFVSAIGRQSANKFLFTERGNLNVKGKGMMKTYFLTAISPATS